MKAGSHLGGFCYVTVSFEMGIFVPRFLVDLLVFQHLLTSRGNDVTSKLLNCDEEGFDGWNRK